MAVKKLKWENVDIEKCNKIRIKYVGLHTDNVSDLVNILQKECGFYKLTVSKELYLKHKLIVKHNNNQFTFNSEPWSYIQIRNCLQDIYNRQKQLKSPKIKEDNAIRNAINLLKENGYIIQKLVPEHYETV